MLYFAFAIAWVGHACIWTSVLNQAYGRRLPKAVLKPWRLLTGALILAFPLVLLAPDFILVRVYSLVGIFFGGVLLPLITVARWLRKPPESLLGEITHTLDLWPELGAKLHGDGKFSWAPRLPFTCAYRVDFTDVVLAPARLPPEWDGLTLLLLSDLHFHGTPSRAYFDRIIDEIQSRWPVPDLVCLAGDYVDTDSHLSWIGPVLGRLQAKEAKLAILGNHDEHHRPTDVRGELAAAGYHVLGNGWEECTIRGVKCVAVGHEGPWFYPPPDLTTAPADGFRLCLSHSPDNFYWGIAHHIDVMLCGHVHGGQIRVPVLGSIFIPSIYGRRFDQGAFEKSGTLMLVNRGLSGKEPLRFRCHPQVMRVTFRAASGSV